MNRASRSYPHRTKARRPTAAPGDSPAGRLVLGQNCVREVVRVWASETKEVLLQERDSPRLAALQRFCESAGVPVTRVDRARLDRLAGGSIHQGAAAFAPALKFVDTGELLTDENLLAVALDGVVDPQNFGAVIRSAVALCRAPVIWAESASAPLTPATFRASAGAIEHARLCRVPSLHGFLADAASAGVQIVGFALDATVGLGAVPADRPSILVIGSEEKGMSRAVRKTLTYAVRLHQTDAVQSLNASVAAGIGIHALMTQRERPSTQ